MKKTGDPDTSAEVLESLDLAELARFCQVEDDWVITLVEEGVLVPRGSGPSDWQFRGVNIVRARKARRLTRELDLNVAGVALVLDLLEERDRLRRRLSRYEMP